MSDPPTIFIVTHDQSISDLYALRLNDEYVVRTANSREEAIERIDDDVRVVFLDRRMPDLSGAELLATIRKNGIDCRAAMISTVQPDVDVLEQGFDAAVIKPVSAEDLKDTVETLLRRANYDDLLQEITTLQSERAILERQHTDEELAEDETYQELTARVKTLRRRLDDVARDLDGRDLGAALHSLSRRSHHPWK